MFGRLFSVLFWVLLIYSATVIVPNATVPPPGFLFLYWHILSEAHTVTVQYIQSQYSIYSHNTVHTVTIQYIQSQYSIYSDNTVHTVTIQYIQSQAHTAGGLPKEVTVPEVAYMTGNSPCLHIQRSRKPHRTNPRWIFIRGSPSK